MMHGLAGCMVMMHMMHGWSSDDSGRRSEGIKDSTRGPHGPINYLLTVACLKVHKVSG